MAEPEPETPAAAGPAIATSSSTITSSTDFIWTGKTHPMLLPTVLQRIFFYSDLSDLETQDWHRVCKAWDQVLSSGPEAPAGPRAAQFFDAADIAEFEYYMARAPAFTISKFIFYDPSLPSMKPLLRKYGSHVRSLQLTRETWSCPKFPLDRLSGLLELVPNLETLELNDALQFQANLNRSRRTGSLRLPDLHTIRVSIDEEPAGGSAAISIRNLFGLAPALQSVSLSVPQFWLPTFWKVIRGIGTLKRLAVESCLMSGRGLVGAAFELDGFSYHEMGGARSSILDPSMGAFLSRQAGTLKGLQIVFSPVDRLLGRRIVQVSPLPCLESLTIDVGAFEFSFQPPPAQSFPSLLKLEVRGCRNGSLPYVFEAFRHVFSLTLIEASEADSNGIRDGNNVGLGEALAGYPGPAQEYPKAYPYGVPIHEADRGQERPNVALDLLPLVSLRNMTKLQHFQLVCKPSECRWGKMTCFPALLALAQMKSLESIVLENTLLRQTTIDYLEASIKSVVIVNNDTSEAEA